MLIACDPLGFSLLGNSNLPTFNLAINKANCHSISIDLGKQQLLIEFFILKFNFNNLHKSIISHFTWMPLAYFVR